MSQICHGGSNFSLVPLFILARKIPRMEFFEAQPKEYIFRVPFASSIHPEFLKPSEILPILHEINLSSKPSRRLPVEILAQIKKEVCKSNPVWEDIRSTWGAAPFYDDSTDKDVSDSEAEDSSDGETEKLWPPWIILDADTRKYHIAKVLPAAMALPSADPLEYATDNCIGFHISSADLLYRLRCLFPELKIDPFEGHTTIWSARIRHKQTGRVLGFSEHKGYSHWGSFDYHEGYTEDCIKLLNVLVKMADTDGQHGLTYFHPAATATRPVNEPRFPAVPIEITRTLIKKRNKKNPFGVWLPVEVSATDLSPLSPFRSLLPILKYDVKSRKIDPINGNTPLTEVISSALLYYRLLGKYHILNPHGNAAVQDDSSDALTTTSVWQMKFVSNNFTLHSKSGSRFIRDDRPVLSGSECYLLFMDDRGLFDIRVNGNTAGAMDHIVDMINELCSDHCTHPYNGLVAGCVELSSIFLPIAC